MNCRIRTEYNRSLSALSYSTMRLFGFLFIVLVLCDAKVDFSVPMPRAQVLSPKGFRVWIPDQRGITFFAFHGNINHAISATETGQFSGEARQKTNNQWVYETTRYQLQNGDTLNFWIYVQHDVLGYVLANQQLVYPKHFGESATPLISPTLPPSRPPPISVPFHTPTVSRPRPQQPSHQPSQQPPYQAPQQLPPAPPPSTSTFSNGGCEPSITTVNKVRVQCRNQLIFEEHFDTDIFDKWTQDIRMPLEETEDTEFNVYEDYNEVWNVSNGHLNIYPKLTEELPIFALSHEEGIESGSYDIPTDRCTGITKIEQECHRTATYSKILPPVASAKFRSNKAFNFKYGRVEVHAKLPKGDWLFPEIYLEPNETAYGYTPFANGLIRIAFIRGNEFLMNNNNIPIGGSILIGDVVTGEVARESGQRTTIGDEHFGNRFHLYSVTWTDKSIKWAVDGTEYGINTGQFKNLMGVSNTVHWQRGNNMAPFDREFHVSLGVGVGGRTDFPDGSKTKNLHPKPWDNTDPRMELHFWLDKDYWQPTWNSHDSGLVVDYVKVWSV